MPLIDLKQTNIFFEDGTFEIGAINNLKVGAVNNVAGYTAGAMSILVDLFTGIIPVGSALTINSVPGFRVTSTVETSGNTTTINFTPALSASVADDDVVSVSGFAIGASFVVVDGFTGELPVHARLKLGTFDLYVIGSTVESGGNTVKINFTPTLEEVVADNSVVTIYGVFTEIKVGEGTITWTETKAREYKKNKGLLNQVRNGDQDPVDVTLNFMYEGLIASNQMTDPPTPIEILKRIGPAVNWVNSDTTDPCGPYAINIRIDWKPTGCVNPVTERVILPYFRYEKLDFNPKEASINCTGKCNATEVIVTRFTQ